MSTPNHLDRKGKFIEKRKEILFSNKTFKEGREEIVVFLKSLISLEQEILNQKRIDFNGKEDEITQLIEQLEDKKLFIELTESLQTYS